MTKKKPKRPEGSSRSMVNLVIMGKARSTPAMSDAQHMSAANSFQWGLKYPANIRSGGLSKRLFVVIITLYAR